jgi:hypothetical protein
VSDYATLADHVRTGIVRDAHQHATHQHATHRLVKRVQEDFSRMRVALGAALAPTPLSATKSGSPSEHTSCRQSKEPFIRNTHHLTTDKD